LLDLVPLAHFRAIDYVESCAEEGEACSRVFAGTQRLTLLWFRRTQLPGDTGNCRADAGAWLAANHKRM